MNFGEAIEVMKRGERVCRKGWDGKGMWLALVPAEDWRTSIGPLIHRLDGDPHRLPWIAMKTADDGLVPWFASQVDVLAEDWEIAQ